MPGPVLASGGTVNKINHSHHRGGEGVWKTTSKQPSKKLQTVLNPMKDREESNWWEHCLDITANETAQYKRAKC